MIDFLNVAFAVLVGLIVFAACVLVGVVAYHFYMRERRRAQGMARVAKHLGLDFCGGHEIDLLYACRHFHAFGQGEDEWLMNTMHGPKPFGRVAIFDYRFALKINDKTLREYQRTYGTLELPRSFEYVCVRPENMLDKVSALAGFDDINFESARFNREYFVRADDKRAAYEVMTPAVLDCLLRQKGLHMEIGGNYVVLHRKRSLKPAEIIEMYYLLKEIGEALADKGNEADASFASHNRKTYFPRS